jgi:hypothetical protein
VLRPLTSGVRAQRIVVLTRSLLVVAIVLPLGYLAPGSVRAQSLHCETFNRSRPAGRLPIQRYLDNSKAAFVRKCGDDELASYCGASAPTRADGICSYEEMELELSQDAQQLIEPQRRSATKYLLLTSKSQCPLPDAGDYAAAYDVPASVFGHLVTTWTSATSSVDAFQRAAGASSDASTRDRLLAVISSGKGGSLRVLRVFVERQSILRAQYSLHVADPNASDRFYGVDISRSIGGTYKIATISRGIY